MKLSGAVIVVAGLLLAAGGAYAQQSSEFDNWNGFGVGSSVTLEMEMSGMKMVMTTTLKKKEADKLTVETVTEMSGSKMPGQERVIEKPKTGGDTGAAAKCPKCNKDAASHCKMTEAGKERVKVGDKEIECTVVEMKMSDCDGKDTGSSKTWTSKEVPGGTVKTEGKFSGMESKQVCTAFEAKK